MVFAPHNRVTMIGTLGGSQPAGDGAPEAFAYGFSYGGPFGGYMETNVSQPNDNLDDLVDDCIAFHRRPATAIALNAVLQMVKVAVIGADGRYLMAPYIREMKAPGGSTYGQVYPQLALAVSLNTARRGPSGKGRFFLPMPILQINPVTFIAEEAAVLGVRDSARQLLDDVNNRPGPDFVNYRMVVASTKGFNTDVTGVRVGRVVDTMRSRRRSLAENYTAEALASAP